jgi:HK97 family phage portal protein
MKLFGFDITRTKKALNQPSGRWFTVFDWMPGAWQTDTTIELDNVLTFSSVFACIRLITTDIGKLGIRLVEKQPSGIWKEIESPSFSAVLRKPNHYQTRIKFYEYWLTSKLIYGNTYSLKGRDNRGVVTAMRILDPTRVTPLVSDRAEVFYRLRTDTLAGVGDEVIVPATEIIHDVHMTPENPLIGVSPIAACGLAATQGLSIQGNSRKFFENMSRPSGMLSAPGAIADSTATRLKTTFETNFGGDNIGKLFVAGDGLEFKGFTMPAEDAQLIEQLKWTSEDVCRAFGVPAYKIGVGPMPAHNNIESLNQQYYSETLQELIECIELLLDEGLELPGNYGTEFDLDGLLRMDSMTFTQVLKEQVGAGLLAPDEGRLKLGLDAVPGGKYPYLQQQNYSLEALAKRDSGDTPFGTRGDGEDLMKNLADTYGVGVRAGLATPQLEDEEFFRQAAGLPVMSDDAKEKWLEFGGTRDPITLRALVDQLEDSDGVDVPDNVDDASDEPTEDEVQVNNRMFKAFAKAASC